MVITGYKMTKTWVRNYQNRYEMTWTRNDLGTKSLETADVDKKATSLSWLSFNNKLLLGKKKIVAVFFFIYSLKFDFYAKSIRDIGINYIYSFVVVFSSPISVCIMLTCFLHKVNRKNIW